MIKKLSFKLYVSFWSRLKLLFGKPLYIAIEAEDIKDVTVIVTGEIASKIYKIDPYNCDHSSTTFLLIEYDKNKKD